MRFIFECENEVLLPFLYDFAEDVEAFLKKTNVLKIRENRDGNLSLTEQGRKNFKDMLKKLLKDYPAETGEILDKMWILEEGETAPNAIATLVKILSSKGAIDFFTSLTQLGLLSSDVR